MFNQNVQRPRQRVCYADPFKMHKKTEIPFWKQSKALDEERPLPHYSPGYKGNPILWKRSKALDEERPLPNYSPGYKENPFLET